MAQHTHSPRATGRRRRIRTAVAAGIATVALALSGCAGGGSAASDPNQTLRVGLHGGGVWEALDPHVLNSGYIEFIAEGLFEPLFAYDGTLQFQNVLGESITSNADYTQWTVKLKPNVTFTDGSAFDADDVVATFQRILDPATGASSGGQVAMVKTVTAVDPLTVDFALTQPTSWFPTALADGGSLGMVPTDFDPAHPVSTGPYKFVNYQAGVESNWTRYDGYHGTPAKIKDLVLVNLDDGDARTNALVSGQVDMITEVSAASAPAITAEPSLKLEKYETGGIDYISLRTDQGITADVRVRQAVRLAVDRDKVVDVVFGSFARKANDLYGPFDPNFDSSLVRTRDIAKATQLIQEAGVVGQKLVISTTVQWQPIAEIVAEGAREAGLDATAEVIDEAVYWPSLLDYQASALTFPGEHILTMAASTDTETAFLNTTHFADPEYNALYAQAGTVPVDQQGPILQKMQEILFDRGGFVIPVFKDYVFAHKATLTGWPTSNENGHAVARSIATVSFTG